MRYGTLEREGRFIPIINFNKKKIVLINFRDILTLLQFHTNNLVNSLRFLKRNLVKKDTKKWESKSSFN